MSFDVLRWSVSAALAERPDAPLAALFQGPAQADPIQTTQTLSNGTDVAFWDYGVIAVTPPASVAATKDVVISCAVHGDETAPIEMVRDMLQDILSERLVPSQRVLFLIANPAAILNDSRFVDVNMNRLFSGAHNQGDTAEHQRASDIERYVSQFFKLQQRYHYDLHTAIRDSKHEQFAVYPFTHGEPYSKQQLTFLAECGVDTILLNRAPTTTFSYYSVQAHKAHAFTVELGKVRPFGQNDMSRFAQADSGLRKLISTEALELPEFSPSRHHVYDVCRTINRQAEQFALNFPDDVANFTEFAQGHLLATDGEIEYRVEQPGERIIFPNANVAIGQRALLTVVPIALEQLKLV